VTHHHSVAGARVDELTLAEIDADVRDAAIRIEKDQVSRMGTAHRGPAGVVLRVGCARQADAQHREDVLDEARAIESGRYWCHRIHRARPKKRSALLVRSPRHPGGSGKDATREAPDAASVAGRRGHDQTRCPLRNVWADGLGVDRAGYSGVLDAWTLGYRLGRVELKPEMTKGKGPNG